MMFYRGLVLAVFALTATSVVADDESPAPPSGVVTLPPVVIAPKLCNILRNNIDFPGYDVGNVASVSADDCLIKCKAHSACHAVSWSSYDGGVCWLKAKKKEEQSAQGVISGIVC